jgi:predicted transposase/invertase (TIGR01784 family)
MISQYKYLSPFTDYGFKKIFGEEAGKKSLISFLNDVLPRESKIKELKFLPGLQLGNHEEERAAIYDIYCKDDLGNEFIVEMQNARQLYFKDRTVFYSTFPIQRQAEKGNWNFKLKEVYCVSLLGFEMPGEGPEYLHKVQLKNQNNKVFYDKLTYIYIELPKFNKNIEEIENHLEKWIFFLKNLEDFEVLPEIFKEEIFIETLQRIDVMSMSKEEYMLYERSLKYFRDAINVMETARIEGYEEGYGEGIEKGIEKGIQKGIQKGIEKGIEKGIQKGIEQGIEKGKIEVAKQLLINGVSEDIVSISTGLNIDVIKNIK